MTFFACKSIGFFQIHFIFLNSVDLNFKSWGRSSSDLHLDSLNRRGKGGVCFLWRRNLDKNITVLEELGNDRIIVLKVNLSLENDHTHSANQRREFSCCIFHKLFGITSISMLYIEHTNEVSKQRKTPCFQQRNISVLSNPIKHTFLPET